MDDALPVTVAVLLVGVALAANPVWLFPHDGETRYTYERVRIGVEDGTLTYRGQYLGLERKYENDLAAVGCQVGDRGNVRLCAFDAHLVQAGPVTVHEQGLEAPDIRYVRIGDRYYRRLHGGNDTFSTYDVERVPPRRLLADVAYNVTGLDQADVNGLDSRIAVSGDTVTTRTELDDDELGRVYRRSDGYYTVVMTESGEIDRGVLASKWVRVLLGVSGLACLLVGLSRLWKRSVYPA